MLNEGTISGRIDDAVTIAANKCRKETKKQNSRMRMQK